MEALLLGLYILGWIAIGIILIYLIVRRIGIMEVEDFEKRDN